MGATVHRRFLPIFSVCTALLACTLVSSPSAIAWSAFGASGTGVAARLLGDLGYLPLHPSAYARAKAEADARVAARAGGGAPSTSSLATALPSWQGLEQSNVTPPDPNGAIGPSRYVEMVNLQYGVYDRSGSGTLLAQGSLYTLTNDFYISDPEVIWDPATQRFYYTMVDYIANTIKWGFSNSDKPDLDGFCNYTANFGYTDLPDYPRLGDTQNFLLVGVNLFANFSIYQGSDVDWMQKPPPSTGTLSSCPTSFIPTTGKLSLTNSTPVPAVQTDPSTTGWVVAAPDVSTAGSTASSINVFQLTESGTGNFFVSAQSVAVQPFSMPASAPQLGTSRRLDTLDGRLERAIAAFDPNPNNSRMAVWTAHAVAQSTSPVAEERWYEIGVTPGSTPSLLQSGKATDPNAKVFIWNGAISPDRAVVCSGGICNTGTYGSHMAMTVNTSSTSQYPAIDMVTSDQPTLSPVQSSTRYDADFSCRNANSVCRWGDYSGAMPDPTPGTLSVGAVWLTNEWNVANSNLERAAWRTWNWEVQP